MNEMELYRRLQSLVSEMNRTAMDLYHGSKTMTEAITLVKPLVDDLHAALVIATADPAPTE